MLNRSLKSDNEKGGKFDSVFCNHSSTLGEQSKSKQSYRYFIELKLDLGSADDEQS